MKYYFKPQATVGVSPPKSCTEFCPLITAVFIYLFISSLHFVLETYNNWRKCES